jgi:6-phosphogluconolactonase (cycloisomerase 2 family)
LNEEIMKTTVRTTGIAGIALTAAAVLATPAFASPQTARGAEHPVFVQTDNPGGNTIVAYDQGRDGTLTPAGTYSTGGLGGVLDGSVVDHLASEGSLTYDARHGLLYAVNAGSDTITVFSVRGDRLSRKQVITSGGRFPVSVTVHGDLVYVLNALDGGSIQGYRRIGDHLLRIRAWNRKLGLDPAATPQFTTTPGQVGFTPDGDHLVVTTKGNGNSIQVFRVSLLGALSAKPVITTQDGTAPFGFTFDSAGRLVVTQAGLNAVATYTLDRSGKLSLIQQTATGQNATCWIVATGPWLYASNTGSGTLSGYRDSGTDSVKAIGTTATDAGTVDAAATPDGRYLYVQTGKDGNVNAFRVNSDGSLTRVGTVTVPGAAGGEGIVAL